MQPLTTVADPMTGLCKLSQNGLDLAILIPFNGSVRHSLCTCARL